MSKESSVEVVGWVRDVNGKEIPSRFKCRECGQEWIPEMSRGYCRCPNGCNYEEESTMAEFNESDGDMMEYLDETTNRIQHNLESAQKIVKELGEWGKGLTELVQQSETLVGNLERAKEICRSLNPNNP